MNLDAENVVPSMETSNIAHLDTVHALSAIKSE